MWLIKYQDILMYSFKIKACQSLKYEAYLGWWQMVKKGFSFWDTPTGGRTKPNIVFPHP